jgi:hypothetical protein
MKTSFLVSVGAALGVLASTAAIASTVTTEHGRPLLVDSKASAPVSAIAPVEVRAFTVTTKHGRPLLVEAKASAPVCEGVVLSSRTDAESWQDAFAGKRIHELVVQASWQNALADKRVQDRAHVLASGEAAMGCVLTY